MAELQQIMASGVPWLAATSIAQAQAGGGGGIFGSEGNIALQISSAGVTPAATGSDYVVAVYNLPALTFDQALRAIEISAYGTLAGTTNAKTIKIIVGATAPAVGSVVSGGTTIASATNTATSVSGGWSLMCMIAKYGIAGSNTQQAIHFSSQMGALILALVAPQNLTLTESATIPIAVTANAATTATDIVFNMFQVNMMN